MRIVAGTRKGMLIKNIDGESTRPTRSIVREALFNILYTKVVDSKFLDLFAGSGAIGIEALSRGASVAYFSDNNPKCFKVLKENIEKTRLSDQAKIFNSDYKLVLKKLQGDKFDIIYVDPPYHTGLGIDAIQKISEYDMLSEDGIIILEADTKEEVPEFIGVYERYDLKKYGRNVLNLFRRKG